MFAMLLLLQAGITGSGQPLQVELDRKHRDVVLTVGPLDVPHQESGHHHGMVEAGWQPDIPLLTFAWPIDSWAGGFHLSLRDAAGRPLSRRLLHHLNLIHQGRRQLAEPVYERTFAIGQETADIVLPPTLGVRLERGAPLAIHLAFHNEAEDLRGVMIELRIRYLPSNMTPAPYQVIPVPLDIGFTPGGENTFDVPPGNHSFERDFVFPISGRMLGLGGHLHDHARSISLVDLEKGKVLVTLHPVTDSSGRVLSVEREIYGAYGGGLRIQAGRRYRVVAEYDNPTGATIEQGGMGILGGIFMPDDLKAWPALDLADPALLADRSMLERRRIRNPPPGGR